MCRKRILRFCVLIGGVIAALLIVAVITEKWRGRNRLNRVLQQIESAGATLDLEAAFNRNVPDADNGAIGLSNLTELIHGYEMPVDFPPREMLVDSPGVARSGIDRDTWKDASGNTYHWTQLDDALGNIHGLMARISDSAGKPSFASPFDPSNGVVDMKLESLPTMPGVMRICIISCMLALKDGNGTGAIQSVDTFLNFYCNRVAGSD